METETGVLVAIKLTIRIDYGGTRNFILTSVHILMIR